MTLTQRLSWILEQYKLEITRLQTLLRNPQLSHDEREIAQSQLRMTQEEYKDYKRRNRL